MKKHLVAFLSMIGLAGSISPLRAQVVKGDQEKANTKTESTIKLTNANTEKNASTVNGQRKDKWKKANAQKNATKTETWVKGSKNAAENNANKNSSKLKLKQETLNKQNTNNGQKNALTKAGLTKAALTKAKNGQQ